MIEVAAPYLQMARAVLAGIWLGCLVFTALVVSPALKRMDWPEATRVLVRSAIGRHFRQVANPLLVSLALAVILAGLSSPLHRGRFVTELALLAVVGALASSHGFFFGARLQRLAQEERRSAGDVRVEAVRAARGRLQRLSFAASMANLVASFFLALLAALR